jgi:hypothetical protein
VVIDAERACLLHGNLKIMADAKDNEVLTDFREGDRAAYKYIDFGTGLKQATFMVAPGADSGSIMIGLDNPWVWFGPTVQIPGGGDGKTWTSFSIPFGPVTGVHAVWLVFHSKGNDSYKLDWFKFE